MCKITDSPCSSKPLLMMTREQFDSLDNDNASNKNNTTTDNKNESNRKRRVRFGTNVEHVFEKDFTSEDHSTIWYTGDEFVQIKSGIYAMIRSMHTAGYNNNNDDDDGGWHWRGFEHVQERRPRKEIRRKHVEDLLYFQKVMGVMDPYDLGLLVASNSRACSQRARDLGLSDEVEAQAIYREEGDKYDTLPDAASLSESDSDSDDDEDDDDLFLETNDNTLPLPSISHCQQDDRMIHLLGNMQSTTGQQEDKSTLSLLYIPYKLALLVFPCIC